MDTGKGWINWWDCITRHLWHRGSELYILGMDHDFQTFTRLEEFEIVQVTFFRCFSPLFLLVPGNNLVALHYYRLWLRPIFKSAAICYSTYKQQILEQSSNSSHATELHFCLKCPSLLNVCPCTVTVGKVCNSEVELKILKPRLHL